MTSILSGIPDQRNPIADHQLLTFGLLFLFVSTVAAQNPEEAEELAAFDAMFGSGVQEEDYYQANQLLSIATKRNTPLRKAPAIASIVNSDDIRNMGARNLMDVLKMVPGFGISVNERGAYQLEVRGITSVFSEKVLLMIDGHSVNKNFTGSPFYFLYHDMPVESIEHIEIVRGPGSALYGSNATVAVINVVTRNAVDTNGLELKTSIGSYGNKKLNGMYGKIFDNGVQLYFNAHYASANDSDITIEQDCLSTPGCFGGIFADHSLAPGTADTEYEKTNLLLKLSYGDWAFKGEFLRTRPGSYIGFGYALAQREPWGTLDNVWGDLRYNHHYSDEFAVSGRIYYDYFEQTSDIDIFPPNAPLPGVALNGKPEVKNGTYGVEIQLDYDPHPAHHLIFGALYERTRQYDVTHDNNFGAPNFNRNVRRDVFALYVQEEWDYSEALNFTLGVRYDDYSDFGGSINPRAGVVWLLDEDSTVKLLYGSAFRAPNNVELYNAGNPSVVGNPDLKAEEIDTLELGWSQRFSRIYSTDLSLYRSKFKNIINIVPPTAPLYTNSGGAEVEGMELGFNAQYSGTDYLRASLVLQNPRDTVSNKRLAGVPRERATLTLNYAIDPDWIVHANLLWTGERPRFAGDLRDDLDAYFTLDVALTADNLYEGLTIQAAAHNLLDEEYFDPDSSGASALIPNDFPREGRSFMLNITYEF